MKKGVKRPDLYRARIGICPVCSNSFRAIKDFKERKQKYCSKACWSKRSPPRKDKCLSCTTEYSTYEKGKKYCSKSCADISKIGTKVNIEVRKKMSASKKGYIPVNIFKSGKDHPFWNPIRTNQRERLTKEYKDWRLEVLKRDNYQCKICKIRSTKGNRIIFDVDHIKSFSRYPELRLVLSNGRTLCRPCHKKTDNWQSKERWINKDQSAILESTKQTFEEIANERVKA
jgi:5-methylcytosine-specific restriction endonuclease McrA